jgi:predicted ferric reductase
MHILGARYYLSIPRQRVLWRTVTLLWLSPLAYVRIIKPWILRRRPYELKELIEERGDSWTLVVEPVGHEGLRFMPGQFAWLTIGTSPFAIREHPFAIASSAESPQRLHFTIKEMGDFTSTIGRLSPGESVYVDGPYGSFSVDRHEASGYVFIAGGIGITPVMSMLRTLADRGDKRPVVLFYGNATWNSVVFREEFESLVQRLNLQVVHVLEQAQEGYEGETGFITSELLDRYLPEDRLALEYFVCGPTPMLDGLEHALQRIDVPLPRIHARRHEMV